MYLTREKVIKTTLLAGIIVVCVMIVSVILNGVNQFKLGSQLASVNQVSNLSHLLVRQQAKLFSLMLVKNVNNDELIEALDAFAKEEFVIDANLYAANGSLIAQSHNALQFKKLLLEEGSQPLTQQIVEPILTQQNLIGFLRVTFDSQYGQTTQSKIEQLFHQLYAQLIILLVAGALFASSIHYFLRPRAHLIHSIVKLPTFSTKKQAQRFHSQRRRFNRK
ncbi:hemolysin regulation protein AhpA [[Haemophilus] ducreyi]|uniref:AphA (Smp-like) protein n=2 Tax=Haemophilus ducreyi TaxID=730 RepID=Q7VNW6_HAEDU|nr:YtjB family periplasmic protein [[Haemophilus] ducreyi]AAP95331.1 AphA (smp-like) protein [[Haemophilus] ducreyi 35000HP]AKO30454.1 hemolysin regulation protein AhpA [[Haemophilus] ducreyi]AKO31889.1 hemolysin regulation protein AhpA [[Haemophilus] ducreyi]AKO33343.1 hemolysin regulation protein AhpA [[Haemophilus] ducreyi]AKO34791.1 hemolysin regulation protein AhpA [[Haemophilus] ducreyi]